jgi:DNA polymerase-4
VSYNKVLAKLASDYRKPDGLFVIAPSMGQAFVGELPVSKFHGVGPVTAAKMAIPAASRHYPRAIPRGTLHRAADRTGSHFRRP